MHESMYVRMFVCSCNYHKVLIYWELFSRFVTFLQRTTATNMVDFTTIQRRRDAILVSCCRFGDGRIGCWWGRRSKKTKKKWRKIKRVLFSLGYVLFLSGLQWCDVVAAAVVLLALFFRFVIQMQKNNYWFLFDIVCGLLLLLPPLLLLSCSYCFFFFVLLLFTTKPTERTTIYI